MRQIIKLSIFCLLLSINSFVSAQSPVNLTNAKAAVEQYYLGGAYDAEMDSIMNVALQQLRTLTVTDQDAVIFDVDETAIANLPHIMSMDYGFRLEIWNDWVKSAQAKAIPQVKRLYDTLIARGVKVIFLTGRMDEFREATRINLQNAGYTVYDSLITRFTGDGYASTGAFKTAMRKMLVGKGYHIIMCIGDQESDHAGGYTGIKIKLPNYLYIID